MDGPQASCTPMPLSESCSDVRTNSNGKTIKLRDAIQGGCASGAGSGELAGWWHRTVPYPSAPVEPAGLCWRRSRSVASYRGSCSYRGPCGVEQDLGICKKCAGASVQQHNRGRRTASQERRSRRPQRGGLEAKRWVTRHEGEHAVLSGGRLLSRRRSSEVSKGGCNKLLAKTKKKRVKQERGSGFRGRKGKGEPIRGRKGKGFRL